MLQDLEEKVKRLQDSQQQSHWPSMTASTQGLPASSVMQENDVNMVMVMMMMMMMMMMMDHGRFVN